MNPITETRYALVRYIVLWHVAAAVWAVAFGPLAAQGAAPALLDGAVFGAVSGFLGIQLWNVLRYGAAEIRIPVLRAVMRTVVGAMFIAVVVGAEVAAAWMAAGAPPTAFATTIPARCLTVAAVYVCFVLWYSSAGAANDDARDDDVRGDVRDGIRGDALGDIRGDVRRDVPLDGALDGARGNGGATNHATANVRAVKGAAGTAISGDRGTAMPAGNDNGGTAIPGENGYGGTLLPAENGDAARAFPIDRVTVRGAGGRIEVIPTDEIVCLRAEGDYVAIVTARGRHLKEGTMKWFEEALPRAAFVRVHRSYIVAVGRISRIETSGRDHTLTLRDGAGTIRISDTYYRLLKQRLGF